MATPVIEIITFILFMIHKGLHCNHIATVMTNCFQLSAGVVLFMPEHAFDTVFLQWHQLCVQYISFTMDSSLCFPITNIKTSQSRI